MGAAAEVVAVSFGGIVAALLALGLLLSGGAQEDDAEERGCTCPSGSERTCERADCGRRG